MKTILCLIFTLLAPLCVAQNLTVTLKTGESEKNLTLVYANHEQDGKAGFVVKNNAGEMGFMAYDKVTEETLIAVIKEAAEAFGELAALHDELWTWYEAEKARNGVARNQATRAYNVRAEAEIEADFQNRQVIDALEGQREQIAARQREQQAQIERLERIEQRRRNEPLMGNQGTVIYTD